MDFLKALFESGALTWEEFSAKVTEAGYKLADLATGNYVAKKKYDDEVGNLNTQIGDLKVQIATRDTDMEGLRQQLEDGSKDNKTKVAELSAKLTKLQGDYDTVKTDYEAKLNSQAYEFAVREYAGTKKFSSKAAQKDFITEMVKANLKMKDRTILGADDFAEAYGKEDPSAFVVENPTPEPTPDPKPTFVQPTPPTPAGDENPFSFNFSGVR